MILERVAALQPTAEAALLTAQNLRDASWANIAPYLEAAAKQDEKYGRLTGIIVAVGLASVLPIAFYKEPIARGNRHSARLSRLKLSMFALLIAIELLGLLSWYLLPTFHATMSPSAAATNFAISCTTGLVIDIAAKRPYSWLVSSVFLLLCTLSDLGTFIALRQDPLTHFASGIMLALGCCRFALVVMQLLLPRHVPWEIAEGVDVYASWHQETKHFLTSTILNIFENMSSTDALPKLGTELDPKRLSKIFDNNWQKADKTSDHCLRDVCLQTVSSFAYLVGLLQLLISGFIYSQPMLLDEILAFYDDPQLELGYSLALGVGVAFLAKALLTVTSTHTSNRMQVALRGALSLQILQKTSRMGYHKARSTAVPSLIDADITDICGGIALMYSLYTDIVHIVIGVLLLFKVAGPAAMVDFLCVMVSVGALSLFRRIGATAEPLWRESRQRLITEIAHILSQLQVVKMLGLHSTVAKKLQSLQATELQRWLVWSEHVSLRYVTRLSIDISLPGFLALCIHWLNRGEVTPSLVFRSLILSYYVSMALQTGMQYFLELGGRQLALRRVQSYLLQPEVTDQREVVPSETFAIRCVDISIAPEGLDTPLLRDINVSIEKGSVTLAVGPSRSGKSTFLQALAGEANITHGSVLVDSLAVAYCDQMPFLRNISIRDNILAGHVYRWDRYDRILRTCLLHEDIKRLAEGEDYIVGVNGMNLSGGQRHRVALARGLYSEAETVILDNSFGSLDPKSATSIMYQLCGETGLLRREKRTVIISTYMQECFDVADQLLVFSGSGQVTLQKNSSVDFERVKNSLPDLVSPPELNPEEEHHKQLAAILRSRYIRTSLTSESVRPDSSITTYPRYIEPLPFLSQNTGSWMIMSAAVTLNILLPVAENALEYLMGIWVGNYPGQMLFPLALALLSVAGGSCFIVRRRMSTHIATVNCDQSISRLLIDRVFRSSLAYIGAMDINFVIKQFDQSAFKVCRELPERTSQVLYMICNVCFRVLTSLSGASTGLYFAPVVYMSVFIVLRCYMAKVAQLQRPKAETYRDFKQHFRETLDGARHIRAFGWKQVNAERTLELLQRSQRCFHSHMLLVNWSWIMWELHAVVIITMTTSLAVSYRGISSPAGISVSFWSSLCLKHAFAQLARTTELEDGHINAFSELSGFIENLPLERQLDGVELPDSWPEQGAIKLENVTSRYRDQDATSPALREVSLNVRPGEKVAIAGRTGSGKSSLLLSLLGFLKYQGNISIDGIDISTISLETLRSRVISLTYDPLQILDTVRRNLMPFDFQYDIDGTPRVNDEDIQQLLIDLGIWALISHRGGLDTIFTNLRLSPAEMQLFSLGRAILHYRQRPSKLVLMDEATSALDTDTDERIQRFIRESFPRCTILMIAHRQTTVRDAQRFIELSDGSIASNKGSNDSRNQSREEQREVAWDQLAESSGGGPSNLLRSTLRSGRSFR